MVTVGWCQRASWEPSNTCQALLSMTDFRDGRTQWVVLSAAISFSTIGGQWHAMRLPEGQEVRGRLRWRRSAEMNVLSWVCVVCYLELALRRSLIGDP